MSYDMLADSSDWAKPVRPGVATEALRNRFPHFDIFFLLELPQAPMEVIDFGVEAEGLSASRCCHRLRLLFSTQHGYDWETPPRYLVLNALHIVMQQRPRKKRPLPKGKEFHDFSEKMRYSLFYRISGQKLKGSTDSLQSRLVMFLLTRNNLRA